MTPLWSVLVLIPRALRPFLLSVPRPMVIHTWALCSSALLVFLVSFFRPDPEMLSCMLSSSGYLLARYCYGPGVRHQKENPGRRNPGLSATVCGMGCFGRLVTSLPLLLSSDPKENPRGRLMRARGFRT